MVSCPTNLGIEIKQGEGRIFMSQEKFPREVLEKFKMDDFSKVNTLVECGVIDTTKRLMSSPKCRSVEVINNPARPGSTTERLIV